MGGNLAKSPLIALFYAALLHFISLFLPLSDMYGSIMYSFGPETPLSGYLFLFLYCLWIAAAAALVFAATEKLGFGAALLLLPASLGLQWIVPMFWQFIDGEPSGVMTQSDTLMRAIQGCLATLIILLLCTLLYTKKPTERPAAKPGKYKLRILRFIIFLLVLPIIYSLLHFILGYVLAWRNDAVRLYLRGGDNNGIMDMIINMLLHAGRYALYALLKGLLIALFSLPLMLLLPGKRVLYIVANIMLCLSGAILYLLPNPTIPDDVSLTLFIANAVILTVYGGLSAFLLHLCLIPPEPAKAPAPTPARGAPAAKPPAPARR